jgi:hypothetical protein
MTKYRQNAFSLILLLLCVGAIIAQQPTPTAPAGPELLHPMFQDHAILQRDRPIKIYGDTAPRADVTATLGAATISTRAGTDGHWSGTLPAMPAGGPYTLTATANGETETANDVFIGDVFLCAGQSNMEFSQRQAQGGADDAHTATDAQIRQLRINNNASPAQRHTFATAVASLIFFIQAPSLPPPFPRDGATKLFENERVVVWDVAWLRQAYPVHRHVYDYAGVYYTSGDRIVISEPGTRSPAKTVAWDTFFFRRGVTHSEEGASDEPLRAVFVEFKEPNPLGPADMLSTLGRKVRESERVVIWESFLASSHSHARDAVVVSFTNMKPRVTFVPRGTMHNSEETPGADRTYLFELK